MSCVTCFGCPGASQSPTISGFLCASIIRLGLRLIRFRKGLGFRIQGLELESR